MSSHGPATTHSGEGGLAHAAQHAHPGAGTYVLVGTVLAIITLIEVGIFYWEPLRPVLVPMFLLLSASKFVLVVGFYMHLKFDSRLYTAFFGSGLLIALATFIGVAVIIAGNPPHLTPHG